MVLQVFGTPAARRNKAKEFQDTVAAGIGGASKVIQGNIASRQQKEEDEAIKEAYGIDLSAFKDPKERLAALTSELATKGKEKLLSQKQESTRNALGMLGLGGEARIGGQQEERPSLSGEPQEMPEIGGEQGGLGGQLGEAQQPPQQKRSAADIPDYEIAQLSSVDPQLGNLIQKMKDTAIREKQEGENLSYKKDQEERKLEREDKKEERAYNIQFSKPATEKVEKMREGVERKELALNLGRSAIESGQVGEFSKDFLADKFNLPFLRTSQGAQLTLAAKEQLFPNLARISAKAQNQYMEQRMSTMVPLVGQSQEANLTVQEILEGEDYLDRNYIKNYDRLSQDDIEKYGYERKDLAKRAQQAANIENKEVMKRTSFRLRQLEEQEKGLSKMKEQVGKNVPSGTPLTLGMAKLYKDKFGDKAKEIAKKNGYYIPTVEEFKIYQMTPQEFREEI